MNSPIPVELSVVEDVWRSVYGGRIFLTPSTEDARSWIETEAPKYGQLFPPLGRSDCYDLFVSRTYKRSGVARYLRDGYKA